LAEDVNGSIRYTAKELFEKIDGKLDAIDAKLDDKIGRQEFEKLAVRVAVVENSTSDLRGQIIRIVALASGAISVTVFLANYFVQ